MKIYDSRESYGKPAEVDRLELVKPPKTQEFPFKVKVGHLSLYFSDEDLAAIRKADDARRGIEQKADDAQVIEAGRQRYAALWAAEASVYQAPPSNIFPTEADAQVRAAAAKLQPAIDRELASLKTLYGGARTAPDRIEVLKSRIASIEDELNRTRERAYLAECQAELARLEAARDAAENPEWGGV